MVRSLALKGDPSNIAKLGCAADPFLVRASPHQAATAYQGRPKHQGARYHICVALDINLSGIGVLDFIQALTSK
ncbi:hypothetical protein E2C01_073167 [Portunus trituberculatus]|uniref:Uncharacterized protein n=1 Tax=Portunus trituberculatus TaxID=210409 RepID=A0A5B7I8Q7_PORTR|nr:hypothetical protein [Portunus trituberculatus]